MKGNASAVVKTAIYLVILIFVISFLFKFWEVIGFLGKLSNFFDGIIKAIFG